MTKLLDAMEMLPEAEQRGKIAELEKALRGLKREDHDDIARGRDKAHALKAARQELSQQKRREAAEAAAERESAAKALLAEITGLDPAEQLQKKGALSEALKGLRAKDGETWLAEARETLKDLTARERAANTTRSASRSAAAPPARRWAKVALLAEPLCERIRRGDGSLGVHGGLDGVRAERAPDLLSLLRSLQDAPADMSSGGHIPGDDPLAPLQATVNQIVDQLDAIYNTAAASATSVWNVQMRRRTKKPQKKKPQALIGAFIPRTLAVACDFQDYSDRLRVFQTLSNTATPRGRRANHGARWLRSSLLLAEGCAQWMHLRNRGNSATK